jgi:hypothetical protein
MSRSAGSLTLYPPHVAAIEAALTEEPKTGLELCAAAKIGKGIVAQLPQVAEARGWGIQLVKLPKRKQTTYRYWRKPCA